MGKRNKLYQKTELKSSAGSKARGKIMTPSESSLARAFLPSPKRLQKKGVIIF